MISSPLVWFGEGTQETKKPFPFFKRPPWGCPGEEGSRPGGRGWVALVTKALRVERRSSTDALRPAQQKRYHGHDPTGGTPKRKTERTRPRIGKNQKGNYDPFWFSVQCSKGEKNGRKNPKLGEQYLYQESANPILKEH